LVCFTLFYLNKHQFYVLYSKYKSDTGICFLQTCSFKQMIQALLCFNYIIKMTSCCHFYWHIALYCYHIFANISYTADNSAITQTWCAIKQKVSDRNYCNNDNCPMCSISNAKNIATNFTITFGHYCIS